MLTSPYVAQISFSVAALIVSPKLVSTTKLFNQFSSKLSLEHPEKVTRQLRFLYCALDHPRLFGDIHQLPRHNTHQTWQVIGELPFHSAYVYRYRCPGKYVALPCFS